MKVTETYRCEGPVALTVADDTGRFSAGELAELQAFGADAAAEIVGYLGGSETCTVVVTLSDRQRTPYSDGPDSARRGLITIPAGRFEPGDTAGSRLALHHELTHLIAPGHAGADRLLIEGLAVHVEDLLGGSNYPDGDDTPHGAVRAIEARSGIRIPLAESETARKERPDGEERRLAYAQQGSFVRWLIDTRGLDRFLAAYREPDPFAAGLGDLPVLERQWRSWLTGAAD